jgi:hypothetical protein
LFFSCVFLDRRASFYIPNAAQISLAQTTCAYSIGIEVRRASTAGFPRKTNAALKAAFLTELSQIHNPSMFARTIVSFPLAF